jgi:predicted Rossmann fold nucleotide-binding protein DprA/Smf involved in DNA uptake
LRSAGFDLRSVGPESWCVLGQFPPQAGWRAAQALARNRTIVALSAAVVAFEPRDCGGTWHSSLTALRMGKPLFVVTACRRGARARGLKRLVRLGASALDADRMPDGPALASLMADYRPPPGADQLPLFNLPDP